MKKIVFLFIVCFFTFLLGCQNSQSSISIQTKGISNLKGSSILSIKKEIPKTHSLIPNNRISNDTTSIKPFISQTLNFGDKGKNVVILQEKLNTFGFNLKADGIFGYDTFLALKYFQSKTKLPFNGIADRPTILKLQTEKPTNLALGFNPNNYSSSSGNAYTYHTSTLNIKIEPIVKPHLRYWISTIRVKNIKQVKSAFAGSQNKFSLRIKEPTSVIARRHNAIFAINGAAVGFNSRSFVIRDGIIYRATKLDCAPLEFRKNGSLFIGEYGGRSAKQMINDGTVHTYDFGPDLILNGKVAEYTSMNWFHNGVAPRTAVGQVRPYEYIIITVDGRSSISRGMTYMELVREFQKRGVKWAYNLDGGGSTTLYFKGKVLNHPSDGRERPYSDILYFAN